MSVLVPFNRHNREVRNILDEFFNDSFWPVRREFGLDSFRMDVQENDSAYSIEAELPGVSKDEINLSLEDDRLTISVNRKEEVNNENRNYVHRERKNYSMSRTVYLDNASFEGTKAKLDQGILLITVPKKVQHEQKISIAIE